MERHRKEKFSGKYYEKVEIPLTYAAKDSWDTMTMYAQTYVLLMAVIIGFLTAGIFSGEFRSGTEDVFLAAKYGRSKAIKNKIIAGILMATVVYWIGVGLLSFISFAVMGTSGFFTPYQLGDPYSIYVMTYGEYYLLILVGGYIATIVLRCSDYVGNCKDAHAQSGGMHPVFPALYDAIYRKGITGV